MTTDGYKKSCRKLRKQVLSTELNIRYTNNKFSLQHLTVPVAEWLGYFPFDSLTRVVALGLILFFNSTEIYLSRHHSVVIQPPYSHYSVD